MSNKNLSIRDFDGHNLQKSYETNKLGFGKESPSTSDIIEKGRKKGGTNRKHKYLKIENGNYIYDFQNMTAQEHMDAHVNHRQWGVLETNQSNKILHEGLADTHKRMAEHKEKQPSSLPVGVEDGSKVNIDGVDFVRKESNGEGSSGDVFIGDKKVGHYEFDLDADCFWVDNPAGGQKALNEKKDVAEWFKQQELNKTKKVVDTVNGSNYFKKEQAELDAKTLAENVEEIKLFDGKPFPLPQQGTPAWHELEIAKKTLKMNPAMAGVMGGQSVDEAKKVLEKYGIKEEKVDTHVGGFDYKTIDLRSEKGVKEAEKLKEDGWKIISHGLDSIQFERAKQKQEPAKLRPLSTIAFEIRKDWGSKVNYGAKPYLDAMMSLNSIDGSYGMDSAKSVVLYFLSNASSWRGETAKKIKKELNDMLKGKIQKSEDAFDILGVNNFDVIEKGEHANHKYIKKEGDKYIYKTESGNDHDLRWDKDLHKDDFSKLSKKDHEELAKRHKEIGGEMSGSDKSEMKEHHSKMAGYHSSESNKKGAMDSFQKEREKETGEKTSDGKNSFVFFYNGKKAIVTADTMLEAKKKAIALFKPKKSQEHMVHGMLAEKDGKQVTHTPDF